MFLGMSLEKSYVFISKKIGLIAVFSALVFVSSLFNKFTLQGAQIIFSIIYATGVLVIGFSGAATIVAIIAGSLYMFQSSLGFMILSTFVVRGLTTDLMFLSLRVFREAKNGIFNWVKIAVSMMIASFITGLYQYFFFVYFMKALVNLGTFIVSTIFVVAIISNGIGGFIVSKYIMPQVNRIGKPL